MANKTGAVSKAPAFPVLLGICIAVFLNGISINPFVSCLVGVLLCAAWIFSGCINRTRFWTSTAVYMLVLTAAVSFLSVCRINRTTDFPNTVDCDGKIVSLRSWGAYKKAAIIKTEYGKVCAFLPASSRYEQIEEGSTVHVTGAVFDFERGNAENSFDEELYWRAKGAAKKIIVLDISEKSSPTGIYAFRLYLDELFEQRLPQRMADYMKAITLGTKSRHLQKVHRRVGTSHLLAVSGFHVGMLAALLLLFFKKTRRNMLFISMAVWLYVLVSGAAPSAVRAALMLQIYFLGRIVGRPNSSFNSVGVAAIILLLANPMSFYDIGWMLSVTAAFTITALAPLTADFKFSCVIMSVTVWLATAAISSRYFESVPAIGMLINILAVPAFSLLFPLIAAVSFYAILSLPFADYLTMLCEYLLGGWEYFSETAATFVPVYVDFSVPLCAISVFTITALAAYACGFSKLRAFVSSSAAVLILVLYI